MSSIKISSEKCKGCNLCIEACPLKIISESGLLNKKGFNYVIVDSSKCSGCRMCFQMCPDNAIEVFK